MKKVVVRMLPTEVAKNKQGKLIGGDYFLTTTIKNNDDSLKEAKEKVLNIFRTFYYLMLIKADVTIEWELINGGHSEKHGVAESYNYDLLTSIKEKYKEEYKELQENDNDEKRRKLEEKVFNEYISEMGKIQDKQLDDLNNVVNDNFEARVRDYK